MYDIVQGQKVPICSLQCSYNPDKATIALILRFTICMFRVDCPLPCCSSFISGRLSTAVKDLLSTGVALASQFQNKTF